LRPVFEVDRRAVKPVFSGVSVFVDSLKLIRAVNCLLAAIGVVVGAYLTLEPLSWLPLGLVAMSTFLVCAGGNVFNDMRDVELDRIAHPERVLPSGKLSAGFARRLGLILTALAPILAVLVNLPSLLVVLAAIGLLVAYNVGLKRLPFVGNLIIAVLAGGTFLVGGLANSVDNAFTLPGPVIPAVFAVILHLMREIVKDIEDIEGDRAHGARTGPMLIGVRPALGVVLFLGLLLGLAIYWPYAEEWFGYRYMWAAGIGVLLPVALMSLMCLFKPTHAAVVRFSIVLKVSMGIGLLSLILA
jgi:geranylgeranylglycerol-phosphate geranylgeranyltransferase